jgi:hypothetical protein
MKFGSKLLTAIRQYRQADAGQPFAYGNRHPGMSEAGVVELLSSPKVSERLGGIVGEGVRAVPLSDRGDTHRVTGAGGDFVVRFPRDDVHLSALRREERVRAGLQGRVTLLIPDTSVIDDLDGYPPFAIHRMIPGDPLTSECYASLAPQARDRLIGDLVNFFHETHSVSLEVACAWLDIPFDGEQTAVKLASAQGKPVWFGPDAVADMRPRLESLIDAYQKDLFEETVRLFEGLEVTPDRMVFGHGDIHGYNVAMGEDHLGPKIVGVFDLGCAGVLDIHEDFFRLSLVSEDLLERVIAAYQDLPGQVRPIDRNRIAIYYRAFLFYLMTDKSGEALDHLKSLLLDHVEYYDATHNGLG